MFLPNKETPLANLILRAPTPEEIKVDGEGNTGALKASPAFPFGTPEDVAALGGPTYLTAQDLVQQVAYSLSHKIFSYSPDTFALDAAVKQWSSGKQKNAFGGETSVTNMETRAGAASVLLGYVFSSDRTTSKQNIPQSVIASSATLLEMQNALDQLSLLYSASTPFVAHVAALDYSPFSDPLVTDYSSALRVAQDTGIGLLTSSSAHEAQHMALLATAMSSVLPTVHVYDGVKLSRESTRVVDVLDQTAIVNAYQSSVGSQESSKREDSAVKVSKILSKLNAELGTSYSFFEYAGHQEPDVVLVVFGSAESSLATQVASTLSDAGRRIGVISVRIYRPFAEEEFLKLLPESVKRVAVLGQVPNEVDVEDRTVQSPLYEDVLATLTMSDRWTLAPPVVDVKYSREQVLSPKRFAWIFKQITSRGQITVDIPSEVLSSDAPLAAFRLSDKQELSEFLFLDLDDSELTGVPASIARFLATDSTQNVSYNLSYDNLTEGGIVATQVRASKKVIDASYSVENADVVVINDAKLLASLNAPALMKSGSTLILRADIKDEDVEKQIPASIRRAIAAKDIKLDIVDVPQEESTAAIEAAKLQLVFLGLIGADISSPSAVEKALHYVDLNVDEYLKVLENISTHVRSFEVPKTWAEPEVEENETAPTASIRSTSFSVNEAKHEVEVPSLLRSPQQAAIALSFKEAYDVKSALRPDLPTRNFIIKVKENKRLTPQSYDRNIFHIEFDTTDTGMTYEIGEALGIHAHNDVKEVDQFIKDYGLNPTDIVEAASKDDPDVLEMRTVHQALLQNVDIFGRPPKRFYEALAEFATNEEEKKSLLTLTSPEGAVEFKRRAEVDTVTYADVLQEFPSARPDFHQLVKIISPLKRREYSIASSQVVNPTSVHLLIVVVSWKDPRGRDRFGQATRYLSRLPVGAEVTVSVKPSVMKLPPLSTQPLIMAGLGTGLAPFRAFVQYRAWQKSQGIPIGDVLLYMGSRHQREEYLYGEEWEAYEAAGVITRIGKAFSRDQPQKIYIQDRMRQSIDDIVDAYLAKEGAFYLCGPTWPVPDVSQVLMEAISIDAQKKGKKVDERRTIESLKDVGRYVLEVY